MTRIHVDAGSPLGMEPGSGHNRWHPGIEPLVSVRQGDELTLETRDGLDGQLTAESSHADAGHLDLGLGHPLTGPVYVEGAVPGDLLEVELLGYETSSFGVTAIIPGFGFLSDVFGDPYLVKWKIDAGYATSEDLPGVAIPQRVFPGVLGVAPSFDVMTEMHRRELELAERGGPVADQLPERAIPPHAADGLRTIPPRENGGNLDIPQLTAGSKAYFPVYVEGALVSVGDLHFAQGEGESCGTGIEITGAVSLRFSVHKGSLSRRRFPYFRCPATPALDSSLLITTGLPLDAAGTNYGMDLTLATREALLEMIELLRIDYDLDPVKAYIVTSIAVDLRLSEIVDVPNPVVSAILPESIFAHEIAR